MNRFFLFVSLLLWTISSLQAQSDTLIPAPAEIPMEAVEDNPNNALLWKISGKELEEPSYLYGTIHIIPEEDFFLTEATKTAFDAAEQVTFEVDMDKMDNPLLQLMLMKDIFMKDKMTLQKLLSEEDYAVVKAHFVEQGMESAFPMFERIKPMFTQMMASMDMEEMQKGGGMGGGLGEGMKSYEFEFAEMAKEADKKIQGLETISYQMSMFDSIPYEAQAEMLVETIKMGSDSEADMLQELVDLYKSQNIEAMVSSISADESGLAQYEDLLLNTRNKNWIPVMEKQMSKKTTFFAVGAGHLAGEEGVINLLRAAGYTLEPMK